MTKLLNKPLKVFIYYAFLVLLCSIPVYFYLVDFIWINEIKKHNQTVNQSIRQNFSSLDLNKEEIRRNIALWNKLQPETKIQEVPELKKDSSYNIYKQNNYLKNPEINRFEGLISYFQINGQAYSITNEINIEESYETIAALTFITILFFVILLGGFILLNRKISAKLWMPFRKSLDKMKYFNLHEPEKIFFEDTEIIEFKELNESLRKLIDNNIAAYLHQKEFTENAAHELQTPIAIAKSKIDILLQSQPLSEEQFDMIDATNKALSRVSRINKNLLLLSKIENKKFEELDNIALSPVIKTVLTLLEDFINEKKLTLTFKVVKEINIKANTTLIELLLTNLLMNAIRHSLRHEAITIHLENGQLSIENPGKATLDKKNLFKRFASHTTHHASSGLGLAIVQQICHNYSWQTGYTFTDDKHFFFVKF